MYSNYSDETLVRITLLGDENAYATLVKKYEACVIRTAMSITGNRHLAEDAAQDAFVSAWIKLNTLKDPSKFSSWIQRIVVNCAKNLAVRYRDYISLDKIENYDFGVVLPYENIEESEVKNSVSGLSEKVKQVVELHYFHDMSIADIAEKLRLPVGTVKRRLYDGRNKLRKDLGYMNDEGKTLLEAVMQRVEALKMWRVRNSKEGFEQVYNELIIDIDKLPESKEKYFAKAETLMQGFWWLPGEKKDNLITELKDAAEKGENKEVLAFLIQQEENKLSGDEKIEFILNKQIPHLKELCYPDGLAYEYFWLGGAYWDKRDFENAIKYFKRSADTASHTNIYYATALTALEIMETVKNLKEEYYHISACGESYKYVDGKLYFWQQPGFSCGASERDTINSLYFFASRCDSIFFDENMKVGETYYSSDGNCSLTYEKNGITAETAVENFENCKLFITKDYGSIYYVYYKDGVGLVRFENKTFGLTATLKDYHIAGGKGLFPMAVGNRWEYESGFNSDYVDNKHCYEIVALKDSTAFLKAPYFEHRTGFDENSWNDMIYAYRSKYYKASGTDDEELQDVSKYMDRAKELAKTKWQKIYTDISTKVMQRIFDTNPTYNKNAKRYGRWNFFLSGVIQNSDGKILYLKDREKSFEWKDTKDTDGDIYYLLNNFVYDSLENNLGCLFSDEFVPGTELKISGGRWSNVNSDVKVKSVGKVKTKAGVFENCLKLEVNAVARKWWYMVGRKDYYFAKGVGLIRYVSHYDHIKDLNYDLTSYIGTGDGYFPIDEGMLRTFEVQGAPENIIGKVEYTYIKDDNGQMIILADQTGLEVL